MICNHHEGHSQRDILNTFITLYLLRIMFPTLMMGYLYTVRRTIQNDSTGTVWHFRRAVHSLS